MRTRLMAIVAAGLMLVLASSTASAGWAWCARDPIVRLNGALVQIIVSVPQEYRDAVNGPIQVDVLTPAGVSQELVFTDEGFNGYGEAVRFISSPNMPMFGSTFSTVIRVRVPIDAGVAGVTSIPARVEVILPDGTSTLTEGLSRGIITTAWVTGVP